MEKIGTIVVWLSHEHGDWMLNEDTYHFPDAQQFDTHIRLKKTQPWHLGIDLEGVRPDLLSISVPIPVSDSPRIMLTILWNEKALEISINMKVVYMEGAPEDLHSDDN